MLVGFLLTLPWIAFKIYVSTACPNNQIFFPFRTISILFIHILTIGISSFLNHFSCVWLIPKRVKWCWWCRYVSEQSLAKKWQLGVCENFQQHDKTHTYLYACICIQPVSKADYLLADHACSNDANACYGEFWGHICIFGGNFVG